MTEQEIKHIKKGLDNYMQAIKDANLSVVNFLEGIKNEAGKRKINKPNRIGAPGDYRPR